MARWVPTFVMPCKKVVQLLMHASLLRGLRLVRMFLFFFASGFRYFLCNKLKFLSASLVIEFLRLGGFHFFS
jgi:hypothetical protein